jgi:hypothetical protein
LRALLVVRVHARFDFQLYFFLLGSYLFRFYSNVLSLFNNGFELSLEEVFLLLHKLLSLSLGFDWIHYDLGLFLLLLFL